MNRAIARRVDHYSIGHLLDEIRELKYEWLKYNDSIDNCKLCMNYMTYRELERETSILPHITDSRYCSNSNVNSVFGLDINIDNTLEPFSFVIKEDREMDFNNINIPNMFGGRRETRPKKKLPKKYIINKGATVLFWEDGTKTVVKRAKDDEYNKIMGFLWAYFQKTSGLSRTKANEYLRGLVDADDLKAIEFIKSGELNNVMSNVAEGLSNAFKNIADNFKPKK